MHPSELWKSSVGSFRLSVQSLTDLFDCLSHDLFKMFFKADKKRNFDFFGSKIISFIFTFAFQFSVNYFQYKIMFNF